METMEKLRKGLEALVRELYEEDRKVLVHGEGVFSPRIMLIGEAPGEQETLLGRPFVGKAGKNLDEFLQGAQIRRDELYISNAVKFRPTRISKAGRPVNRPPTQEEISLFLPWLKKEIALVGPEIIVTLGNVPLRALLGRGYTIGQVHGQFLSLDGRPLYAMYHPASVIYNPSLKSVYAEDLARLAQSRTKAQKPNKI